MKNFLKANPTIKKKDIKRKLKMIKKLTGVSIQGSQLARYKDESGDELSIPLTIIKYILGVLGFEISSIEVRVGDFAHNQDGEWKISVSSNNHSNELVGIYTELKKGKLKIGNFTRVEHIDQVKAVGGVTWEDWYEESAKASSLRQTIKLSSLAILVKPIIGVVKIVKETGEIKTKEAALSMLEELELEIKNGHQVVEKPVEVVVVEEPKVVEKPVEVVVVEEPRPPEEVFSDENIDDKTKATLANLKEIEEEASKPRPLKNLSRVKWMEERDDIEERFRNGETEDELSKDIELLESRKPYGIKSEVINLSIAEPVVEPTNEVIEPTNTEVTTEVIETTTEEDVLSTPFDPEPDPEKELFHENMSAEEWVAAHRELDKLWKTGEFGENMNHMANKLLDVMPSSIGGTILTREAYKDEFVADKKMEPVTKPTPSTSTSEQTSDTDFHILVGAWKIDKLTLETKWKNREISDEEAIKVRDRLIDSVPEGFGAGVIKIGKGWENERVQIATEETVKKVDLIESKTKETPIVEPETKIGVEKMTVRAWMGGFGGLEKRFKSEGGSKELYEIAISLQNRRPDNIKDGMIIPDKYKAQEA